MDSRVGTTFGKYTIVRLIGKGGMGEVFEAHDTTKGRTVALKILADQYSNDESFRTRFQRESQAAAILQEPHVIPIHDWGEIEGNLYIDMRLVKGHTLGELIADGPLTPARAVAIISQVGAALDAAHAEGLIHRDVKPQNIIVTAADFAYLVDFGIAEARGDTRLTATGAQIGTLNYMAPERFTGQQLTLEVDVYALACVLYESLTGEPPFPGDSIEQLLAAHIASPPPQPSAANPRVPARFDEVIARGMAKDADDRYGTAGGLSRAAQRALHTGGANFAATVTTPPTAGWAPTTGESEPVPAPTAALSSVSAVAELPSPQSPPATSVAVRTRPAWVLPTAVAVAVVLVLGGIGVIIGLLAQTARTEDAGGGAGDTTPAADSGMPPLVTGQDLGRLHQSCDQGFALPTAAGFGTHGGRGTPETSCFFANSVLTSYWAQYGNASPLPRAVSAPGTVDCNAVPGAVCQGSDFLMQCQQFTGDNWITCTGGTSARVYLW